MGFRVRTLLSVFMLISLLASLSFTAYDGTCGFSQHFLLEDAPDHYCISLLVYNSVTQQKNLTYTTEIAYRGILLGAMRKLQASTQCFNFTIKDYPDYGPYLVSVNGVAENTAEHTYWELLVQLQNGTIIRPDVGVGCYIPNPHDTVILKFTKWYPKKL